MESRLNWKEGEHVDIYDTLVNNWINGEIIKIDH